jgi:hypothetical protein
MDMRVGTWNVRNVYRAGSLMTVSRELSRKARGKETARKTKT